MKIIRKTIRKAYSFWSPNPDIRCYHYAAAFDGKKMIAFTGNNPIKTNTKAHRLGEQFNIPKYIEYPYTHAESHLVVKLLNSFNTIESNWSCVVLRINRQGRILMSKPCINCQKILDAVGLNKVYWSLGDNIFATNNSIISINDMPQMNYV
jgi:hypothetical protein